MHNKPAVLSAQYPQWPVKPATGKSDWLRKLNKMALSAKSLRLLSFVHVALGVLAIIGGLAAMLVTNYYNGLYGMGIWLGCWVSYIRYWSSYVAAI